MILATLFWGIERIFFKGALSGFNDSRHKLNQSFFFFVRRSDPIIFDPHTQRERYKETFDDMCIEDDTYFVTRAKIQKS